MTLEEPWLEGAHRAIDSMAWAPVIGVDTETTGIDYIKDGRHYLVGVSTAWFNQRGELESFYFPFRHKRGENLPWEVFRRLVAILSHQSKKLVFANLKFDAHSFLTAGFDLSTWECEFRDIRIEQHYLNENFPKGLDVAARVYLKEHKTELLKDVAKAIGWENIPSEAMDEYARQDARLTLRLHQEIYLPQLRKTGLESLMAEAMRYRFLLFKMEQEGVGLDAEFCARKVEQGEARMKELRDLIGFDPNKRTQLAKYLLEDLQLPVIKRSPKTGAPSFDKEAMEEYDGLLELEGHSTAKQVLEYRGWSKAVSSLYEPAQRLVSPDGRIRTNLNQTGTRTGRLSSNGPNLQQLPRTSERPWNGDAKRAFHSGEGEFVLVGFDYSQLELRLATHYGKDPALREEFAKDDADPFRAIALGIFGEFTPDTRQSAKTFTYATNYGAGLAKVARQLGVTRAQVEEIYQNYQTSFPGIFRVSKIAEQRMKERGYIKYWTGRRRRIPAPKNEFDKDKRYAAYNSLLQGGGAELVKRAQLAAPHDANCKQVLQVHDEIVFKIRRDMVDEYTPQIIHAMTTFPEIDVRLAVAGKEWS